MFVSITEAAFLGAETKELLVLGLIIYQHFVFCALFSLKHLVSFYHRYFLGEQATNHMVNEDGEELKT